MSNGLLGQSDTCNEVDVVDDAEVGGAFHGDLDRLDVVILENADVSHKSFMEKVALPKRESCTHLMTA